METKEAKKRGYSNFPFSVHYTCSEPATDDEIIIKTGNRTKDQPKFRK